MRIYKPEWLTLSKEIKLKLIRLAILENQVSFAMNNDVAMKQHRK